MMKLLFLLGLVALAHAACVNNKNTLTAKKPWMPAGPALGVEILIPEESLGPIASAPGGNVPLHGACHPAAPAHAAAPAAPMHAANYHSGPSYAHLM